MKSIFFTIALCAMFFTHYAYIQAPTRQLTTNEKLIQVFGTHVAIGKAVLMAESGLNEQAIGYNCMYHGVSKACKPQDRPKAYSVDCGIGQINVKGKVCPSELMTIDGSIPHIAEKYKTQGFKAWVAYKTKAYVQFLSKV